VTGVSLYGSEPARKRMEVFKEVAAGTRAAGLRHSNLSRTKLCDHTLEAVVRKLGVNRQQSLARVRRTWGIREKVPEFLNPTKECGFIQPQSGGKDAFDSEPACLS
jgi:hypothetical protein